MIGLVGLGLMVALTILYRDEIGWGTLGIGWLLVLGVGFLALVLNGWIVLGIQTAIIAALYAKANAGT